MNWSDVAATVGKYAPMLGTVLAGPAGGAVGALVSSALGTDNTPAAVSQALALNPDAAVKLQQIEKERTVELQGLMVDHAKAEITAQVKNAADINGTMVAESKSEHWAQWAWRPFIGMAVGFNVIASSVLTLLVFIPIMFANAQAIGAVAQLPMVLGALAGINGTVLPILGVASWYRGKQKIAEITARATNNE